MVLLFTAGAGKASKGAKFPTQQPSPDQPGELLIIIIIIIHAKYLMI